MPRCPGGSSPQVVASRDTSPAPASWEPAADRAARPASFTEFGSRAPVESRPGHSPAPSLRWQHAASTSAHPVEPRAAPAEAPIDVSRAATAEAPVDVPRAAPVAAPAPAAVATSAPEVCAAWPLPSHAVPVVSETNDHVMLTRGKRGFRQPKHIFDLHVVALSLVPKTYRGALTDPNWRAAMTEEFSALLANNTWDLISRLPGANLVTGKWVFSSQV